MRMHIGNSEYFQSFSRNILDVDISTRVNPKNVSDSCTTCCTSLFYGFNFVPALLINVPREISQQALQINESLLKFLTTEPIDT